VKTWSDASNIGRDALVIAALAWPAANGDWQAIFRPLDPWEARSSSLRVSNERSRKNGRTSAIGIVSHRVTRPCHSLPPRRCRTDTDGYVVAGAVIGETSGFLITPKPNSDVRLMPWGDTKSAGIAMAARF
jgi:hypothetical protein